MACRGYSDDFVSIPGNNPPYKPSRPIGSSSGNINEEYTYISSTIDPDEDVLYYLFDWGDGTSSDWLGPLESGEDCNASHKKVHKMIGID